MTFHRANVFTVRPEHVDAVREWLVPYLQEFERTTCLVAPEDVIQQAKSRDCQLWSYHDKGIARGVVATRIHTTSIGKLCSIWVCIGVDANELIDGMLEEIERWAANIGCYAIEIVGREGWRRRLKGYERKAVVLEKRLRECH